MSIRTIKIYSTLGVSGQIETNVRTLAELKPLLAERDIDYNGMQLVVGATKTELSLDEAVLPEGNFKLYLMPIKTKSGNSFSTLANLFREKASINEEIAEAMEEMSLNSAQMPVGNFVEDEDAEAMKELIAMNNRK